MNHVTPSPVHTQPDSSGCGLPGHMALWALVLLFVSGCAARTEFPMVNQFVKPSGQICKIAVLPFVNETEYNQAGPMVYRIFMVEFMNYRGLGGELTLEGDIRKIYRQLKISPNATPNREQMRVIAQRLNVQAVVTGQVMEIQDSAGKDKGALLALKLTMADPVSGKVFWSVYHHRHGDYYRKVLHFGVIETITELVKQVSREVLDSWRQQGLSECTSI